MAAAPRGREWSLRAFRALLALYPGEFRDEYGREMAMVFADRYRDAPNVWERALVWFEAVSGVLKEAPKEHLSMILQDLRYAWRLARANPVFTATAVLTLALGIGANTAIFQLIDAVRFRSLPVHRPSELAEIRIAGGNGGFGVNPGPYGQLTRPVWEAIRSNQQAFSAMFAWSGRDLRAGPISDLRRTKSIAVSGEFFQVLGIKPFRGRLIEPSDETTCPTRRAVISHAFWQREMGGAELAPDARLLLNLEPHEIIGVTPPGFFGVAVGESFDVAVPLCRPQQLRRELFDVSVMGRLSPGWTIDRASAHLDALSAGIFDSTAPTGYSTKAIERFKSFRLAAYAAASGVSWLRAQYETSLRLLLAITALVLLIACANLANLMLARATARGREVAIRLALGASGTKLLRQFFTESCLLAAFGAVLGVVLARVLSRALIWGISTQQASPHLPLATDWRILGFTASIAVATCVVFGLLPALRASRVQPSAAMAVGGRAITAGHGRFGPQRLMVVTQIAVSLVLLFAALLFVRSFNTLMTLDPGMRQEDIIFARLFQPTGVASEQVVEFQRGLVAEIATIPGIQNAATTSNVPLLGSSWGHGVRVRDSEGSSMFTWVSPGYFDTMGIRVLEGRDFALNDTRSSPRVAIVNQSFVRQFVKGNPLGQTLLTSPEPGFPATVYEIVGVIPDTKYDDLRHGAPAMAFAPDTQHPLGGWMATMIHSNIDPSAAILSIKRRLAETHPAVIAEFEVFEQNIRDRLIRERVLAILAGFFGALAAILAMVGLYGMIAFMVAERRREIGVRVALGAQRRQVIGMMMIEAARLLAIGLVAGIGLSLVAGQSAATLLFGVTPRDGATLAGACLLLTVIAAAASFLPARAASRLDPLIALRQD